jgi:hypothetical protein
MRFYFVNGAERPYTATLEEAKKLARIVAESYNTATVELVEVDTTKENILRLLNIDTGTHNTVREVYTTRKK